MDEKSWVCHTSVPADTVATEEGDVFPTGIRVRPWASEDPPPRLDTSAQGIQVMSRVQLQSKPQIFFQVEDSSSGSETTEVRRLKKNVQQFHT